MAQKDVALKYAENGISIFPCDPNDKSPLTKKGYHAASTDTKKIKSWWTKHPDALIGGACDNQFTVLDFDFDKGISVVGWHSLLTLQFGVNTPYTVTTKSEGQHLYFKYDESITRRIKLFTGIDILGKGGYAILPDNGKYQVDDLDSFIDGLKSLPEVPSIISSLSHSNFSEFQTIFESSGVPCRNIRAFLDSEKKDKLKQAFDETSSNDSEKFSKEEKRSKLQQKIDADKAIYERNQNYVDTNKKSFEIDESGAYIIPAGVMEKGDINHLFYDPENQKKMAAFMGVPLPTEQRRRKFRSVIYGHSDDKPSMGSRWSETGNHIIVRDFSNFFGDAEERTDYSLTRLYMQNHYSQSAGKPVSIKAISGPEFCVWTLRLLSESGVINFERTNAPQIDRLSDNDNRVMKSYLLLHDIKRLYNNYEGKVVFSKRFASAWSGIKPSSVLRSIWELKNKAVMVESGKFGEGKFAATLFAIGEAINTTVNERSSNMPQEQLPLGILFGAEIDSSYKETLKNFCEDFEIENIIEEKYMAIPIATSEVMQELKAVLPGPIIASEFMLYTLEEDGRKSLLVGFESPMIEKIFYEIQKSYELDEEEPDMSFVLSFDYTGDDSDEAMNELSYQFNQYFPMIEASQEITGYYTEEELDRFVFGSDLDN